MPSDMQPQIHDCGENSSNYVEVHGHLQCRCGRVIIPCCEGVSSALPPREEEEDGEAAQEQCGSPRSEQGQEEGHQGRPG